MSEEELEAVIKKMSDTILLEEQYSYMYGQEAKYSKQIFHLGIKRGYMECIKLLGGDE